MPNFEDFQPIIPISGLLSLTIFLRFTAFTVFLDSNLESDIWLKASWKSTFLALALEVSVELAGEPWLSFVIFFQNFDGPRLLSLITDCFSCSQSFKV